MFPLYFTLLIILYEITCNLFRKTLLFEYKIKKNTIMFDKEEKITYIFILIGKKIKIFQKEFIMEANKDLCTLLFFSTKSKT